MMTDKYEGLQEEKDENSIIAERRAKLAALREQERMLHKRATTFLQDEKNGCK